ncbi:MAG TPA: hypothetical protein VI793_11460 [Anaerolineales bacterium]|nr:hypothetical protein [Anaerolineales bacterium]
MTPPTLLLAVTLATLYGAGFHLWQGGGARRLALYLLAGWLGFTLGHWVGEAMGVRVMMIGALNFASATLGSLVALVAARWLATSEATAPSE